MQHPPAPRPNTSTATPQNKPDPCTRCRCVQPSGCAASRPAGTRGRGAAWPLRSGEGRLDAREQPAPLNLGAGRALSAPPRDAVSLAIRTHSSWRHKDPGRGSPRAKGPQPRGQQRTMEGAGSAGRERGGSAEPGPGEQPASRGAGTGTWPPGQRGHGDGAAQRDTPQRGLPAGCVSGGGLGGTRALGPALCSGAGGHRPTGAS